MIEKSNSCLAHENRTVVKTCRATRSDCNNRIKQNDELLFELYRMISLQPLMEIQGRKFLTATRKMCNKLRQHVQNWRKDGSEEGM